MKRKLTKNLFLEVQNTVITCLLFMGLFIVNTSNLNAQCDQAAATCEEAIPMCSPSIDFTMPGEVNNSGAIPGCGGGWSFHNTTWYQITAQSTSISVTITPGGCQNGGGFQAGLYTDCDPNAPNLGVQCSCITSSVTFGGATTPGDTYYIMIDGCSGDVCEINYSITQGMIEECMSPPLGQPFEPVPDIEPACPGLVVTFSVPPVPGATFYNWNFPPGVIPLNIDCNMATVIWGNSPGNTTVTAINDDNPTGMTSDPHFMDVYTPEGFDGGEYCFPDEPGWFHPGTGTYWPGGSHELVLPMGAANGCDSTVYLDVIERSSPLNTVFEQICPGGVTCSIGGLVLNGTTNGLLHTIPDASLYGCDSTLLIFVEVLDPGITIAEPDTLNCFTEAAGGVSILADFYPGADYLWTAGPGGMIEGPDDENLIFVSQPGWYYLYILYEGTTSDACGFPPMCIVEDSVQVFSNFEEPTTAIGGDNLSCGGGNDGTATVTATDGIPPYTYLWTSGSDDTLATVNNLIAGSYTVTVTGSNGCTSVESITLTEPAPVELTIQDTTAASCFGSATGAITVGTTGGTAPYNYVWSHDGTLNSNVASSLDAGSYSVIATDDNGCADTIDVLLTQPVSFSISLDTADVACNGDATGTATITLSGGTPPYTYTWPAGSGQTGNSSTTLTAGNYIVTVSDMNGCSEFVDIDIDQPSPVTLTESHIDVDCNGNNTGSLSVSPVGGTGNYTYSINSATPVATGDFDNLTAGAYTIEVEDDNGCIETINIDIDEPAAVVLSSVETQTLCNGSNDGTTTITVNGGTGPYTYSLDAGGVSNNNMFTGLAAGAHTVEVVDANMCSEIINISIDEPTEIMVSSVEENATCNGTPDGSSTVTAMGGTGPYTYILDSGTPVTTNEFNGLNAGPHTIEIVDANMCSEVININITQPSSVTVLSTETDASCFGTSDGTTSVSALGGTAPYMFSIDAGAPTSNNLFTGLAPGPHTIQVVDSNMCTQSIMINIASPAEIMLSSNESPATCNGETDGSTTVSVTGGTPPLEYSIDNGPFVATPTFDNLGAGPHTVQVRDDNGCTSIIDVDILEPTAIITSSLETDANCNGESNGTTTITASGGTAPYNYSIDGGTAGTNNSFSGLTAGPHTVEIIDFNGCSEIIDIDIDEPQPIMVSSLEQDATCNGQANGMSTVTASGGTAPLSYSLDSAPGVSSPVFNGLAAGPHTIVITDANGCNETININIDQPQPISLSSNEGDVNCNGGTDGTTTITAMGGTAPYMYSLDNGTAVSTPDFTGLAAGPHTVLVTDNNGCTEVIPFDIDQPTPVVVSSTEAPASCNGVPDGTSTVTTSGGTAPYMYSLDSAPVVGTNIFNALSAGPHTIEIIDANGCSQTINIDIDQPTPVVVSSLEQLASCNGVSDGSSTVTASGGIPPYNYAIDGGAPGGIPTFNGLAAGPHTIVIADANGCEETLNIDIDEPTPVLVSSVEGDVSCNGGSDGTTTITASGGTAPLSYSIDSNTPVSSPTFTGLIAGPHVLVISDANGCEEVLNIDIAQPQPIMLSSNEGMVNCNGGSDGTSTITVTGGTAPYMYSLDNGTAVSTPDFTGLTAGPHTVLVTDDNGCTEVIPFDIDEPTAVTLAATGTDALCFGEDQGTAIATPGGGTPPYTFTINSVPNPDENFSGLTAGTYTIEMQDANGCMTSTSVIISEPPLLEASAISSETFCANTSDGTVTATGMGGTPPYMYSIDSGAPVANPSFDNQSAGNHTVDVIDANGCTATTMIMVDSPPAISLSIDGTDALCFGEGSGTSTVTATGGTGAYTYEWSDTLSQITTTAEFLEAGMYSVTVTDERGCSETIDYLIGEPAAALATTEASTDATCGSSNGTVTLVVSGGTTPYTYDWSNTGNTATLTGLDPGNFAYTVTDNNGCDITGSVTVNTPSGLEVMESATDASCNGGVDGTVSINVNGGTTPYTITWSDPTYNGQTDLSGLASGSYTVTILDGDGCEITSSSFVDEPTPLSLTLTPTQASCGLSDGSIDVLITGGTPGAGYTFDWSDNTLDGTEDPQGIAQGTYTLVVTDANGCMIDANTNVTVPNPPAVSFSQQDIACNGESTGNILVDIVGGEAPYTFDWSDDNYDGVEDPIAMTAGTYTLIVTDAKNCSDDITVILTEPSAIEVTQIMSTDATCGSANGTITTSVQGGVGTYTYDWSDPSIGNVPNPAGLMAGNYFVTVTDANGCSTSTDVGVSTPNGLELAVDFTDVSCNSGTDGAIDLTITGGSGPFNIDWTGTAFDGMEDLTGLPIGVYDVLVTDNTGCEVSTSVTISEPTTINVVATVIDATCLANDGGIVLTVTGGTPDLGGNYSYQWDNGAGTSQSPNNLGPDTYSVTVTDDNGCTAEFTTDVTIPNAPTIQSTVSDALCNGASDGSIGVLVNGGEAPYQYAWSDPGLSGQSPTMVAAGTYTVTVTDNQNCEVQETFVVDEPVALGVTGTPSQATCGSANGSIDIEVTGGTLPYNYAWSGGAGNNQDPNTLIPGTYIVTITDANNCELVEDFTVTTPNALMAAFTKVDASCNGGADGSIDIIPSGGTAPYTYLWSNMDTNEDINSLSANTYTLAITDADGCVISVSVEIDEPTAIQINSQSFDATCNQSNGSIDITVTGGTTPYTFAWDGGGGNNEDPQNLPAGNYNVTVTDGNGCTALHAQSVVQPNGVDLVVTPDDVDCNGGSDGSIMVDISGGIGSVSNFQIAWSDPAIGSTNNPTGLSAGTYTITVTDEAGCNFTATSIVGEPPVLDAFVVSPTGTSCNGGNDGSIDLDVAGGVAPYTYLWDNSAGTDQDPANLSAGAYNVTVTDANGCTALASETIIEPAELQLSVSATDATCFGSTDGTLSSTVTGGTQPYNYAWTNNAGTDPNPANVPAGAYQLIVTDANGCTIDASTSIAQPAMIEINITDESDNNGFNLSCSDATDGYVSVLASGGNAPFSYAWDSGATGTSIDNVAAGTHIVEVTDAMGCTETLAITLTAPEVLSASFEAVPPICFGDGNGFVFVEQVNGGTGPYVYSFDNVPFNSNPAFNNLHGGDYLLTIQDANGCQWSENVQIVEPEELSVDLGGNFTLNLGDNASEIRPEVTPANTTLVDWFWSSGAVCDTCFNISIAPTDPTVYEFSIEDDKGCIASDQVTVQVKKDRLVYIPNAFSPNGDGVNDFFTVFSGKGVVGVSSFLVFDRWGELVYQAPAEFEHNNENIGWDGSLRGERLNPGVFVYVAEVLFEDGEVIMYKGDVTLMSGVD